MAGRISSGFSWVGLLLLISMLMAPVPAFSTDDAGPRGILGGWVTKDDKSVVEVYECDNGAYCLKIVWLKEPLEKDGSAKVDKNNPDSARKQDPIIGLTIGSGFMYKGGSVWKEGNIYDPDNGKTYSCKMELDGDSLKVRGFIGVSLFGRTELWKRKQ
ncbi:MAG: DUF2147 domain-containing protein [Pseudomonadota bacterium]